MPPPAPEPLVPSATPPSQPVQRVETPPAPFQSGDLWARALEAAPGKQARAMFGSLRPVELSESRWTIACDDLSMRKMVEVRLTEIEGIVRQVCPAARLELVAAQGATTEGQHTPVVPAGPADEPEIVRLAVELFGARVVNVQRKDRSNGNG